MTLHSQHCSPVSIRTREDEVREAGYAFLRDREAGDPFANRPCDPRKSVRDAWQRAADKRGEQYANDIFPDGKPTTKENHQ